DEAKKESKFVAVEFDVDELHENELHSDAGATAQDSDDGISLYMSKKATVDDSLEIEPYEVRNWQMQGDLLNSRDPRAFSVLALRNLARLGIRNTFSMEMLNHLTTSQ